MDEIQQIIRHLAVADGSDKDTDAHRWEAARLIHGLLQGGDTLREVGEQIGKSHMFVQYMRRTWELGKDMCPIYDDTGWPQVLSNPPYPDFKSIYYSAEVRGEAAAKARPSKRQQRKEQEAQEQEDKSAQGMVKKAAELINVIAENPAFWQLLTEEDIERLEGIPYDIDRILDTKLDGHKADQPD